MNRQRALELLKIERECVSRDCDRDCANCELVQDRDELMEMYAMIIEILAGSAHVMTTEEISDAAKRGMPIYEEIRSTGEIRTLIFDHGRKEFVCPDDGGYLHLCECDEDECLDYNWSYRCWNVPPDMYAIKNTPWKMNPYDQLET